MSVTYYHLKDLNTLGKEEDYVPYLYHPPKGWIIDDDNILMDRIMGYDNSESGESPYKIGNSSIIELAEEISVEEAEKFIRNL